jgi:hypothetical protein
MAKRHKVGRKAKLKMVHGATHSMGKKGKHKGGRRKRSRKR